MKYVAKNPISLSGHPTVIHIGEPLPPTASADVIRQLLAEDAIVEASESAPAVAPIAAPAKPALKPVTSFR